MKLPSYKLRPKNCQTYYLLYVLLVIPPIFRVIRVLHNSGQKSLANWSRAAKGPFVDFTLDISSGSLKSLWCSPIDVSKEILIRCININTLRVHKRKVFIYKRYTCMSQCFDCLISFCYYLFIYLLLLLLLFSFFCFCKSNGFCCGIISCTSSVGLI